VECGFGVDVQSWWNAQNPNQVLVGVDVGHHVPFLESDLLGCTLGAAGKRKTRMDV
jgi:hypothetical protein